MSNVDPETKGNIIKVSCGVAVIGSTSYVIYKIYQSYSHKQLIQTKKEELAAKKLALWKTLQDLKTPFDNMDKFTNLTLSDMLSYLSSGAYKSKDILQAFQAKALTMDKEFNFITDLNPYTEADLVSSETVKRGTLRGVPVSIKECFMVNGCYCTFGMLDLSTKPSDRDEMMVRTVRLQGMIPYVTTNMCQTGLSPESSNPIYGETVNPYNKKRTCGGSSGGEAAILASGASILGLGSDIGGSIRIPASYCGIFGLKPTAQRFSHRHANEVYSHQNLINVAIGPMARRIEDLVIFFKALACGDLYHLDPYCPPLCFNDKIYEKKRPLRIGYYTHLGEHQVTPVPAVVRGVEMAKKALESAGHTVVDFSIPDIDYAIFDLYFQCLFTDGGKGFVKNFLKSNPIDPTISITTALLKIPNFLKYLASFFVWPYNRNYSRMLYSTSGFSSVYKVWELKDKLTAYREKVLKSWQADKLDGIICPVLPICAPPLNSFSNISDIIGYTAIYNVLDYPAGTAPVTTVNQADIDELLRSYPRDTTTHRNIVEYQKESIGMPIGVQCVSMLWREETCLRIMRDITDNI